MKNSRIIFDQITLWSLINSQALIVSPKKRLTKKERASINLDSFLKQAIIGLLLGDGHIQQRNFKNSRFMYGQSSLRQHHYDYFIHVLNLFKIFISTDFKLKKKSWIDKRNNMSYSSVNFATLTLPCFTFYKNLFYKLDEKTNKYVKIVPLKIKELLTPIGLAYWIMDDGSLQNKGLHLSVYAYTYEEVILLKNTLENLFVTKSLVESGKERKTIKCSIHNHQKGFRIYIWEESMELLRKHISPYMHTSMLYKITPKT